MAFRFFLAVLLTLILTGCVTTNDKILDSEIYQLQNKVRQLEMQNQQKEKKIAYLEDELHNTYDGEKVEKGKTAKAPVLEKAVVQMSDKNIQAALKKAGFYKGVIDGVIGKDTKNAVMDFQKANGLKADGVVGDKTWAKLSKYLN